MEKLSVKRIAEAIGAVYHGSDAMIGIISSDSRNIPSGCVFIALEGERFDGHAFAAKAIEDGAAFAVVSQEVDAPKEKLLRVSNTRQALLVIAGLFRRELGVKVVGITGSAGKTTTKEMIACVCEAKFNTLKTEMNLNNEIGLSQMILRLTSEHEVAVLEMGMDGPGQIAPLTMAAAPDIAVVTNIGVSHLETMGTRENIRDEKLSISKGVPDGGTLILNGDDDMLGGYSDSRLGVMYYGIEKANFTVMGSRIKEFSTHTNFEICYNGARFDAQIPCMGRHNVYNALAAFCVGIKLGIEPHIAISALRNYRPVGMRQNIVVHNSFTVVEDCYNASPDSMRAAMQTLGTINCNGKRIAVLSDMLELGSIARDAHYETGEMLAGCGIDIVLCTGGFSILYAEAANAAGMENAQHFGDKEALFAHLKELLAPEDIVWFKASRGMKLEEVIERIYAEL